MNRNAPNFLFSFNNYIYILYEETKNILKVMEDQKIIIKLKLRTQIQVDVKPQVFNQDEKIKNLSHFLSVMVALHK